MSIRIIQGDCRDVLRDLPAGSAHMVCTSPPYFNLRRYLPDGHPDKAKEMGSEKTPDAFVAALVEVFDGVRRVLREDGVCFVNLGDSYVGSPTNGSRPSNPDKNHGNSNRNGVGAVHGLKPKDLIGIPWRFALAMQADGWLLRSAMPWIKRSVMPESVTDRPVSAVEYVFMFTKGPKYFWDATAVQQKGAIPAGTKAAKGSVERAQQANGRPPEYAVYTGTRNFRNSDLFFSTLGEPFGLITDADGTPVALDVNPEPLADAHYAAYPSKLVHPLILAATSERGCCPACGAPWMRQTDAKFVPERDVIRDAPGAKPMDKSNGRGGFPRGSTVRATTGWLPSCACDVGEPVPATVLDPFSGAGTTLMVADRLGRDATGIELNAEYVGMIRRRLTKDAGLFADIAP